MDTGLIVILVVGLLMTIILPIIMKTTMTLEDNSQLVGGVVVALMATSLIVVGYCAYLNMNNNPQLIKNKTVKSTKLRPSRPTPVL